MAIGAHVSSKYEIEHHQSEIKREEQEIEEIPEVEREEIPQIYMKKADFAEEELDMVVNRITSDKEIWLGSMMKEELGLFEERYENSVKARATTLTNKHWLLSGAEMVFVGILAAVIPYLIGDILLPTILSQIAG